jgi:hypothetical protein
MEIVQIVGIIFAAVVILVIAYLYRENAIIEGKTEWGIGPIKFSLGGKAQKQAGAPETPPAPAATPKIEQSATDLGRITRSGPEIEGGAGEIEQTASSGGTIEDSAPKIS